MTVLRFLVTEVTAPNRVVGKLICGSIKAGDSVAIAPSGQQSTVMKSEATGAADELRLEFTYVVNVQEGNLVVSADDRPEFSDQFEATIEWQAKDELLPGREYRLVSVGGSSEATVSRLKYRLEGEQQIAAKTLAAGDRGVANLALNRPIVYDPQTHCAPTSSFTLVDKISGQTVAGGQVRHGLRRASNVHWQALDVDQQTRAAIKHQTPRLIWLTGLSGSGKSTIANMVERKLIARACHSYLLDGDNVRHGLNKDLGFTDADRVENIRRVAETAKLMLDAGLIVITSFISPFRAERDMARGLFEEGEFIEIFVDASLEVCEQRDPKGLYKKARRGEIKNFTGLDSPYEPPTNPEMVIDTVETTPEQAADRIIEALGLDQ